MTSSLQNPVNITWFIHSPSLHQLHIFVPIPKTIIMKTKALILIASVLFFASCDKKDDSNTNPPAPDTYINTNEGSTWTYHEDNSASGTTVGSDYSVSSTNKDTTIGSRKYHVYSYSYGGSRYLNISGHEYYQFDSIPVGTGITVERLYLKDNAAVGTSWEQETNITVPGVPVPIPLKITNNITEKGITRTVKGKEYTDVIHVSSSLSSPLVTSGFTSSIDSYFAPKYGLIENTTKIDLDYMGIVQKIDLNTQLTSATLK